MAVENSIYPVISDTAGKDGGDLTLNAAKSKSSYQNTLWNFYNPELGWQMPADGYPILSWQPPQKAVLTAVSGNNGFITIAGNLK